jgi:hypothetical protein
MTLEQAWENYVNDGDVAPMIIAAVAEINEELDHDHTVMLECVLRAYRAVVTIGLRKADYILKVVIKEEVAPSKEDETILLKAIRAELGKEQRLTTKVREAFLGQFVA